MNRYAVVGFAAALLAAGFSLLPAQDAGRAGDLVPLYEFRSAPLPKETKAAVLIRFKPDTGETWLWDWTWRLLRDEEELPPGLYDVTIEPAGGSWGTVRFDRASGRAWYLGENKTWLVIKEAGDEGALPPPVPSP